MSAQKELADWLADRGKYPPAVWAGAGGLILAEHGPAIAELIEAAARIKGIATGQQSPVYIGEAAISELCDPLAKLTEPK